MRVVVVGAGALGGLIGAHLSDAGEETILVERNELRARLLSDNGLYLSEGNEGERCVSLQVVTSVDGLGPADLVFIAVKSYQTESAVCGVLPIIGPDSQVLSMQNGIGNTDTIAAVIGPERVLCGITYHSIQHVGPNRLRYRAGIKPIQIAPHNGIITPAVENVGEVFCRAGLNTNVVENIDDVIWQKLLHNAVVNPVSALTGLTCWEMLQDDDLQTFMRDLCMEIVAIMSARGVPIVDEEDPYRPVVGSQKALGKNRPSMWQDLSKGSLTEVDAINGAVVREAERLGLSAPHNTALVHFIHSRERQKRLRFAEGSAALKAAAVPVGTRVRPVRKAADGGLPLARVPLQCTPRLKELLRAYYHDVESANDDPDRRVACASGMGPSEIIRAMGITPFYPENHAALIGGSRQAGKYIPKAMAEGFSHFASSAMASDIGALLAGDSPLVSVYGIKGPPQPDLVVFNTNYGHSLITWFEYYGRHYHIPVFGLHPPAMLDEVLAIEVNAAAQQMLRLISQLEELCGYKLDWDRLSEAVEHSAKATALWSEILALGKNVPSPLTFFDTLIHMAPMVVMRGTAEAVEYYTLLKAELEERVRSRVAAVPSEHYRFYWEGPPIWGGLRPLAELFLKHQVAIVGSTYANISVLEGLDPRNPIETMARAYTSIFPNRSQDYKEAYLKARFGELAVDGVIYHESRTTPEHSNVRYGLEIDLRRESGLEAIIIEADTHDLRLFSMERITSKLATYVEIQKLAAAQLGQLPRASKVSTDE
jgi:2-dehydropantoate 2-reductase